MRVLLTNDDGIDAPGIRQLEASVRAVGVESVVVVAPQQHLSGCSHQATMHGDIQVERRGEGRYAVGGTPVDCVRIGRELEHVDTVVSGINDGANLGVDLFMSGTAAGAREAALLGMRAIALSQYVPADEKIDWQTSGRWTEIVLKRLLSCPPGEFFWNVNFPPTSLQQQPPEVVLADADHRALPTAFDRLADDAFCYRGDYHHREYSPGSDVGICFAGNIAVTPVALQFTTAPIRLPDEV